MSRALAIETSGRMGSIALARDGMLLAEEVFPHGLKHAAEIIPLIDRLCTTHGWSPRDLEELYVSIGPGSFTGLRIGVTLAKTLAFSVGLKLVAVPSVRVLVENAPADARHAIIVLDAKRDQIFTARFERRDNSWVEIEPAHLDPLAEMLARAPRPVFLVGEGIPYHEKFIPRDDPGIHVTSADAWRARASVVAQLGAAMAGRGEYVDPDTLTPLYVRRPEPEEVWERRRSEEAKER